MGWYILYSEEGTGRGRSPSRPLFAFIIARSFLLLVYLALTFFVSLFMCLFVTLLQDYRKLANTVMKSTFSFILFWNMQRTVNIIDSHYSYRIIWLVKIIISDVVLLLTTTTFSVNKDYQYSVCIVEGGLLH